MQTLATTTFEGGVLIRTSNVRVQFRKGFIFRLKDARGARLRSVSGAAWITVERDAHDFVILPGDSFVVPSDRLVLVEALSSTVTLDLQGIRDARADTRDDKCEPIAKMHKHVEWEPRLRNGGNYTPCLTQTPSLH